MNTDYFVLALKSLIHKKVRSWLTLLGIFIGVAAVVSLIGLGDGLRTAINSQFGISSTEVLTVQAGGISGAGPPGTGVVNKLTQADNDAIEKLSVVDKSIPRLVPQGKLEFNDVVGFGMAMSIPDGEKRDLVHEILEIEAEVGRLLKDGDSNRVVLGYNFYSGDADFGKDMHVGNTVLVQDRKFEIVGFTKKKGSFIFDNIVHMNEDVVRDLFEIEEEVDVIAVLVKDKELIPKAKEDIEKLLRKRRDVKIGEEDFEVQTPDQALADLDSILVGVQIFIILIASISMVIGAIGIVNTMFTSVIERRRQIGIMKSVGARNSHIFYQFFIEAGLMGFIGGLIGTIIGTLVAYVGTQGINAWIGSSASPSINFGLILFALLGSFILGAVSGIIPALQAAHQHPVDALRS
ncbi:ABC transporter permease [Candidatus Woesearchaeota archaeon]|nr:ABC transporter permease [Candidatus Woesearchaeota archaeon]